MPLEGVNPAGRLIPENQKTEAAKLGAFQSRVEENARIRPIKDEDEKQQEEEQEEFVKYERSADDDEGSSEVPLPSVRPVNPEEAEKQINFTIRFNHYTELVELIALDTGKIMQTIPPHDLIELISELRYTSGIFIDSEI